MEKLKYILLLTSFSVLFVFPVVGQDSLQITDKKVNFGFRKANKRQIDVIIIHSVFNNSGGEKYDPDLVIKQFARYGVSPHYMIGRDGSVYRLVDEENVAYHAGKSSLPDGRTAVNTCSIGIEVITSFDEAPTDKQMATLTLLVNDLKSRYPVKYVLRHSDIAPGRKTDPWNFDWDNFLKNIN
ncbi:MAG: N-acetylmuramoyl-L-alanine amidase [Paludibacter sp.]|nr:N-acetylmuramoyl-L-alanine amidase [Paludibacter sp.]